MRIDADIQAINRGLDRLFREYGGESSVYQEATKFLRGADAPKVYISKSGALHVSRGAKRSRSPIFGKQVEKIRENIPGKKDLAGSGSTASERDKFMARYYHARDNIDSKLGEWYYRAARGMLSPREMDIFDNAKEILAASRNSMQEIVAVFEMLDEPFDYDE